MIYKNFSFSVKCAVAPMMGWTNRHCRYFHRQLTKKALLYTEMISDNSIIYGNKKKILSFSECEHPIALQIGGFDPKNLAEAARIGEDFGYDEININVGCPSSKLQRNFGAFLMKKAELVSESILKMKKSLKIPVTIKCRIETDDKDPKATLEIFGKYVLEYGADAIWVHARKAILNGISPKKNRSIPPIDYKRVYEFKKNNIKKFIGINGNIKSLDEILLHLSHVDGVMIGRVACYNPILLTKIDKSIYKEKNSQFNFSCLIDTMASYIDNHIKNGGSIHHVTRHMLGLFYNFPGSKRWRQMLSFPYIKNCGSSILYKAFNEINQ